MTWKNKNKLLIYNHIYMVNKKSRTSEISRKLNIFERNVSYKSCRVSYDLFTDLVSLTLSDVTDVKSKSYWFFLNDTYFLLQNLIADIKSFLKRYN